MQFAREAKAFVSTGPWKVFVREGKRPTRRGGQRVILYHRWVKSLESVSHIRRRHRVQVELGCGEAVNGILSQSRLAFRVPNVGHIA